MSNDLQALAVNGKLLYTFDWSDVMPAGQTLNSIDYVLPTPLTTFADSDDLANFKGTVGIQGAVHGATYQVQAKGTLSNGEHVVKNLTIRGFDG